MLNWKVLKAIGSFSWPLLLCLSHFVFRNVGKVIEPGLLAQGRGDLWWAIVLLYWVIDTTIAVFSVIVFRWPIDFRRSNWVSVFLLSSELALLILFLHLAGPSHEEKAKVGRVGIREGTF